eukprot:9090072-Lingulodinium_polyedra.AAC.1
MSWRERQALHGGRGARRTGSGRGRPCGVQAGGKPRWWSLSCHAQVACERGEGARKGYGPAGRLVGRTLLRLWRSQCRANRVCRNCRAA